MTPGPRPTPLKWIRRDDGLVFTTTLDGRHLNIAKTFGGWAWCRMWTVPDGNGESWRWRRGFSDTLPEAKRDVQKALEIAEALR